MEIIDSQENFMKWFDNFLIMSKKIKKIMKINYYL